MFIFSNGTDQLEFDLSIEYDKSLQSYLDASVSIRFSINGFSGSASSYILQNDMKAFCSDLIELEITRKTIVQLNDASEDIEFTIKALDNLGHMGIFCKLIGYGYLGDKSEKYQATAFMEIEPEQLVGFSKESWLEVYNA